MNKPVYLGLSILKLNKILVYKFWYDYVKTKYGKKAKLCYMDTKSFIVYIKTDDIYKDIADVETGFDLKNKFIKFEIKFERYKNCLKANQLENKINYLKKMQLT